MNKENKTKARKEKKRLEYINARGINSHLARLE